MTHSGIVKKKFEKFEIFHFFLFVFLSFCLAISLNFEERSVLSSKNVCHKKKPKKKSSQTGNIFIRGSFWRLPAPHRICFKRFKFGYGSYNLKSYHNQVFFWNANISWYDSVMTHFSSDSFLGRICFNPYFKARCTPPNMLKPLRFSLWFIS